MEILRMHFGMVLCPFYLQFQVILGFPMSCYELTSTLPLAFTRVQKIVHIKTLDLNTFPRRAKCQRICTYRTQPVWGICKGNPHVTGIWANSSCQWNPVGGPGKLYWK